MAHNTSAPALTPGNVIYLYGVLRDAIGVGKQTFITHVEAALADRRLTADDLGFDSTQALLEALGDGVKLTIFKGGRLYATVVAQPDWDAALEAASKKPDQKSTVKGNKPWKRKKGNKAIKPCCPKRVKREKQPDPQPEVPEPLGAVSDAGVPAPQTAAEEPESVEEPKLRNGNFSFDDTVEPAVDASLAKIDFVQDEGSAEPPAGQEDPATPDDAPSIAVVVTYDPYTGNEEETVLTSTPGATGAAAASQPDVFIGQAAMCPPPAPKQENATKNDIPTGSKRAARTASETHANMAVGPQPASKSPRVAAAAPKPADASASIPVAVPASDPVLATAPDSTPATVLDPAPASTPATVSDPVLATVPAPISTPPCASASETKPMSTPAPKLPADLPVDFTSEVYCPAKILHELTLLYPLGADVLGIIGEYFQLACDRGDIEANRRRATFPIRYLEGRTRITALIRLVRRTPSAMGPLWAIDAVDTPGESGANDQECS